MFNPSVLQIKKDTCANSVDADKTRCFRFYTKQPSRGRVHVQSKRWKSLLYKARGERVKQMKSSVSYMSSIWLQHLFFQSTYRNVANDILKLSLDSYGIQQSEQIKQMNWKQVTKTLLLYVLTLQLIYNAFMFTYKSFSKHWLYKNLWRWLYL